MTDLRHRLSELDQLEAPDMQLEIDRRVVRAARLPGELNAEIADLDIESNAEEKTHRAWPRAVIVAAAVVVVVAVVAVVNDNEGAEIQTAEVVTDPAPPVTLEETTRPGDADEAAQIETTPSVDADVASPLVSGVVPLTSGSWTVYGPPAGSEEGRLLLTVDGNGDVFAVSQQTGDVRRFSPTSENGDRSEAVFSAPEEIRERWVAWAVGVPTGGLLYKFGSLFTDDVLSEPGGVIGFEGSDWYSPTLLDGGPLVLRGTSGAEVAGDGSVWIADFGDDRVEAPRLIQLVDGVWSEFSGPSSIVGPGVWNAGSRFSLAPDGAFWSVVSEGATRQYGDAIDLHDFGRSGDVCCSAWILTAPNADVWVHADAGVDRYRDGDWTHFGVEDGSMLHPDNYAIATSDGSVWLSDRTTRVAHFDGRLWHTYTPEEGAALSIPITKDSARLIQFVNSPDGITWVLTNEGVLHRHDGTSWSQIDSPPDIDLALGSLAVTPEGHAWVTSEEQYVARFVPAS